MSNLNQDFEGLFKVHYSLLCNVANRIIKNEEAAEDLVQEVFLKLWQKKSSLHEIINQKAYLIRAVTNGSIDHLKSYRNSISLHKVGEISSKTEDASGNIMQKELEESIERALNLLPPKCRAIFVLSRHEGMKYKEIAEHLGISIKTVENQMGIALEKMRNELKPYLTKEFSPILKASAGK